MVVSIREELPNLDQCLTNGKDPINVNSYYCCSSFIHSININCVIATVAMVITHIYSNLDLPQALAATPTALKGGWISNAVKCLDIQS